MSFKNYDKFTSFHTGKTGLWMAGCFVSFLSQALYKLWSTIFVCFIKSWIYWTASCNFVPSLLLPEIKLWRVRPVTCWNNRSQRPQHTLSSSGNTWKERHCVKVGLFLYSLHSFANGTGSVSVSLTCCTVEDRWTLAIDFVHPKHTADVTVTWTAELPVNKERGS